MSIPGSRALYMLLRKRKIQCMLYAENQSRNVMEAAKNIAKAIGYVSPCSTFLLTLVTIEEHGALLVV